MKKMQSIFLPGHILLIFNACGPTLKVFTDYDMSATFTNFKTFGLYNSDSSLTALSPLNKDRLLNAVITDADLRVNTIAIFRDRVSVSSNTNYYGYGGVYRPYMWGTGMGVSANTSYDVQHYKDGSLIIDIVDASAKKLVWQGTGNREIDKPLSKPDEQIPAAIAKILAGFPPGAIQK